MRKSGKRVRITVQLIEVASDSQLWSETMIASSTTSSRCRTTSPADLNALVDGFVWTAAYQVAEVYAWRGEIERAFEWLERTHAQRDPGVTFTAGDRFLQPLRGDSRWMPFLQKIDLA